MSQYIKTLQKIDLKRIKNAKTLKNSNKIVKQNEHFQQQTYQKFAKK